MTENATTILNKYTIGDMTLEETNAKLKELKTGLYLDPMKNKLTTAEINSTTIGVIPEGTSGYGLLDSGTSTLDKVHIVNGKLVDCDMGDSKAFVTIGGVTYSVKGNSLV